MSETLTEDKQTINTLDVSEGNLNATVAVAASGMLSVHESCPVCTPDPDVVHQPNVTHLKL